MGFWYRFCMIRTNLTKNSILVFDFTQISLWKWLCDSQPTANKCDFTWFITISVILYNKFPSCVSDIFRKLESFEFSKFWVRVELLVSQFSLPNLNRTPEPAILFRFGKNPSVQPQTGQKCVRNPELNFGITKRCWSSIQPQSTPWKSRAFRVHFKFRRP